MTRGYLPWTVWVFNASDMQAEIVKFCCIYKTVLLLGIQSKKPHSSSEKQGYNQCTAERTRTFTHRVHQILNLACLPIPPPRHNQNKSYKKRGSILCPFYNKKFLYYFINTIFLVNTFPPAVNL